MNTAGEDHFRTLPDQFAHLAIAWQRGRDGKSKTDITCGGFRHHIVNVFVQGLIIKAIKMAVRVD
ncbi:hypothetical protein D3C80_2151980 [compost metagenome]